MKLGLEILAGNDTKLFLSELASLVERMEKAIGTPMKAAAKAYEALEAEEEIEDDEFETASLKKPAKKKTESFEDDISDELVEDLVDEEEVKPVKKTKVIEKSFDDEDEEEPKVTKGKKAAKITVDDVNDACMDRATRSSRSEVLSILKTKFKVKSITELKPEQYEMAIKLMQGKK